MIGKAFDRRTTLAMLGGGAAAAAFDITPAFGAVRIRENITTFAANPTKLAALKQGVKVMKDRSNVNQNDPTGWYYWASSHGTNNPVPPALAAIYNQCKHGSPYFYPWHRAFLYYFEQVLRAASGDSTLNLPYWNWYSQPTIPAAFTTPANSTNPLWHSRSSNTVGPLSQTPFTRTTLLTPPSPSFSTDLESDPHGAVHDDIGGDMGFINRSARDPIFWLHHCNVDRLWNVWVNQGHSNPPPTNPWSSQSFKFDVGGTMVKTAGQVTDTTMLNYKYDRESSPLTNPLIVINWKVLVSLVLIAKPIPIPGPGPVEHMGGMEMVAARGLVASALPAGLKLGSQSAQVNFTLEEKTRNRIRSFAAAPAPATDDSNVNLVLEGVQIAPEGREGGFSYRVCVAIPAGEVRPEVMDRQCVAQFGSFEVSVAQQHQQMSGGDPNGPVTLRFPLGAALKALGGKGIGDGVPVTFVARHANQPAGRGEHTYITVKSAHLELGPKLP
jgi:tyrosinase